MNKNQMYQDFKNMIHAHAWACHRTSGIEYDELFAQGNLIFCEALETWDAGKASFSTYLYTCLSGSLQHYVSHEQQHTRMCVIDQMPLEFLAAPAVEHDVHLQDMIARHNEDVQFVVRLVIEQHDKLVATETGHRVNLAHAVLEPLRDFDQQQVASAVAVLVIEWLEIIQIQEDHGKIRSLTAGDLKFPGKHTLEAATIEQLGQGIQK